MYIARLGFPKLSAFRDAVYFAFNVYKGLAYTSQAGPFKALGALDRKSVV